MIEINLLPEELRKKEPQFKQIDFSGLDLERIPLVKIGICCASVLIAAYLIALGAGMYGSISYSALAKKHESILPKKKEVDALRARADLLNKKVKVIDELMIKRFSWSKKLNELSDAMGPGIWLAGIEYDERLVDRAGGQAKGKGAPSSLRYLIISGYAATMGEQGTATIGKFIKNLKESQPFYADFNQIELGAIRTEKLENQEVMSFKVTCLFKELK